MLRLLLVLLLTLGTIAPGARADTTAPKTPRFYAVVFGVVFAPTGDVGQLRLLKVVDPRRGNADAPEVAVPEQYVEAVRRMLSSPRYRPAADSVPKDEVYMYFFHDPARPDRADLDPRPKQR